MPDMSVENTPTVDSQIPPLETQRFPAGLFLDATYTEIEECATAEPGWNQSYHQLGRGQFRGTIVAGHTASVQLAIEEWSPGVLIRGDGPVGSVVFGILASGQRPPHYHGRVLHDNEVGTLVHGEDVDLQIGHSSTIASASIAQDLIEQYTLAVWGEPLQSRRVCDRIKLIRPELREAIHQKLLGLIDLARSAPDQFRDEQTARLLEHEVLEVFLLGIQTFEREPRLAERNRAARQALDYALEHLDQPVTVADLCAAVGVTARTLQLGFQERFGLTPKTYLKSLRLDAIRKRLAHAQPGETAVGIARAWGFFHAGRFSSEYRRQFGESPSQTLARSFEPERGR